MGGDGPERLGQRGRGERIEGRAACTRAIDKNGLGVPETGRKRSARGRVSCGGEDPSAWRGGKGPGGPALVAWESQGLRATGRVWGEQTQTALGFRISNQPNVKGPTTGREEVPAPREPGKGENQGAHKNGYKSAKGRSTPRGRIPRGSARYVRGLAPGSLGRTCPASPSFWTPPAPPAGRQMAVVSLRLLTVFPLWVPLSQCPLSIGHQSRWIRGHLMTSC